MRFRGKSISVTVLVNSSVIIKLIIYCASSLNYIFLLTLIDDVLSGVVQFGKPEKYGVDHTPFPKMNVAAICRFAV